MPQGADAIANTGPHGFSEIYLRLRLGDRQQWQLFCRLSTNTPIYNLTLSAAMLMGGFVFVTPDRGRGGIAGGEAATGVL